MSEADTQGKENPEGSNGVSQCLRWAVPDLRGVFSTPRTVPPGGRGHLPAHGTGRPRPSKAGAKRGARRLTKGVAAPRLCLSSRGEGSDGQRDTPNPCTAQARRPRPRHAPPSAWWAALRPRLDDKPRTHCHPAGRCPAQPRGIRSPHGQNQGATPPASWELSARAEEMAFDLQR